MTRPLYIFDLDGTLANAEHRIHHIDGDKKDWRAFFTACADDAPIAAAITTLKTLRKAGAECWIWTGRSDEVFWATVEWLGKHDCLDFGSWWRRPFRAPERLLMRKAGDHRHDHVIKAEWLAALDPPEFNRLTAVFEDRDRVCAMWRAAGVPCFQVAPGAF